ncbi:MAG TPA: NADH-quinone oxidoreductase subunit M [Candidatus Limnocylindrales bacterium]|nr:NADH-quinone oxidoreductase subunit M [Candidatus Limnocylindrales bacterium]
MRLLSLLVWTPAIGALLVSALPREAETLMRRVAVAVSLVPLALAFWIWRLFDPSRGDFQLLETLPWLPSLGAGYRLGIDGISLLLILLTVVLTPLVLISAADSVHKRVKGYLVSMLLLETTMLGTLVAIDALLFYVFWEMMLIPMYLIIGVWGGERRMYASIKFILFTMVGSLPMLAAIIYVGLQHAEAAGSLSFALTDLYGTELSERAAQLCFLAFFVAFAVKVPMWPLHTWLPDAHVEAPTGGSVILAGVLLKMGTYGFLRFVIPLFPEVMVGAAYWIGVLAVVGIVYGALVAMVQPDMKKLVAYSSVSHLGFVMLGLASLTTVGVEGAVYQMLNHGVSTGALFLLVGVVYERRHTRLIAEYGGLWRVMPVYAVCFLVVMLSSIGLPGLNGFVGEFLILMGGFRFDKVLGAIAASGVVLGAAYMLWMYQRVMFGPVTNSANESMPDMSRRELGVIAPLIALAVLMGVYPAPFFDMMRASVETTLAHATQTSAFARAHGAGACADVPSAAASDGGACEIGTGGAAMPAAASSVPAAERAQPGRPTAAGPRPSMLHFSSGAKPSHAPGQHGTTVHGNSDLSDPNAAIEKLRRRLEELKAAEKAQQQEAH